MLLCVPRAGRWGQIGDTLFAAVGGHRRIPATSCRRRIGSRVDGVHRVRRIAPLMRSDVDKNLREPVAAYLVRTIGPQLDVTAASSGGRLLGG